MTGNTIAGNYIGTDITGSLDKGNSNAGILFYGGANANTIGGTSPAARNVLSGNGTDGIVLDSGSYNNVVQGNWIGINATGTATIGNSAQGIWIGNGSSNNIIGGTAIGAGNVVGGSAYAGIELHGASTTGNIIQGNSIGTDAAGAMNFANGNNGVYLQSGANGNTIAEV